MLRSIVSLRSVSLTVKKEHRLPGCTYGPEPAFLPSSPNFALASALFTGSESGMSAAFLAVLVFSFLSFRNGLSYQSTSFHAGVDTAVQLKIATGIQSFSDFKLMSA